MSKESAYFANKGNPKIHKGPLSLVLGSELVPIAAVQALSREVVWISPRILELGCAFRYASPVSDSKIQVEGSSSIVLRFVESSAPAS